jgi:Dyp-type peroxidase family
MAIRLRLENIQGNVTPGFRSDHQALMLVRLPHGRAAREWLRQLVPGIASAQQVATFLAELRRPHRESRHPSVTWVNVAFSRPGLERLGLDRRTIGAFPEDFRQGMRERAHLLGDSPEHVAGWDVGGSPDTDADVLVILGTKAAEDLERELSRQRDALAAHGGEELVTYRGARLPGDLRDREHFGFRDGVSQPDPLDPLEGWPRTDRVAAPGEFILGYPSETSARPTVEPNWARDGSYLVFRRLHQDVFGFRRTVAREAERIGLSAEQLAAKLVGRWPSGARLGTGSSDPGWDPRTGLITAADFANDPNGERCPRFSHVRKAHPLELRQDRPQRHRLIRRGIPYGPPLPREATADDGEDRGLLFLAYQASLADQFEHIQRRWLDDPDFPRAHDGTDPLVGEAVGRRAVTLRRQGGRVSRLELGRFVSATAGGYFFAPSIGALAHLAGREVESDEGDTSMAYEAARDLGEFILEENPYSPDGRLPVGFQAATEIDPEVRHWEFDGQDRRVRRALRIKYQYRDADGLHTAHLLIGYEGASH